jgi:hypothetical protein
MGHKNAEAELDALEAQCSRKPKLNFDKANK